jgi:pimeloyl-ACP methyl ester carboxylesterase
MAVRCTCTTPARGRYTSLSSGATARRTSARLRYPVPGLGSARHPVGVVRRPGYGGSTSHLAQDVTSAATYVARVADALGIDRFAVMGHSGDGPHALACGALLPERVLGVVSIAGLAPFGDRIRPIEHCESRRVRILSSERAVNVILEGPLATTQRPGAAHPAWRAASWTARSGWSTKPSALRARRR